MLTLLPSALPDDVSVTLQAAGYTSQRVSEEARKYYAAALFRRRLLTLEQSAHLANMSLWDYIPFLGEQGIAVADQEEEDVNREMETARWLTSKHRESAMQ